MMLDQAISKARGRHNPVVRRMLSALCIALCASTTSAQQQISQYQEQGQLIRAPRALATLGNDLLGDQVNLYTGSLQFIHTDVSLPGNSALPVAMGRRLTTGVMAPDGTHFGRWEMEIPHLHGVFANGWIANGPTPGNRCSAFGAPPPAQGKFVNNQPVFAATEFWHGNFIYVPGIGDQEMLRRTGSNTVAPGNAPATYPVVTRDNWQFSCLPAMAYGGGGEAFLALAPDGTTYRFDWMVSRASTRLRKTHDYPDPALRTPDAEAAAEEPLEPPGQDSIPSDMATLDRSEVWILPTVITDRYGNTVTYTYDATNRWQLKTITGIDATGSPRTLTMTYVSPGSRLVSTVSDGTRTWTYHYNDTSSTAASLTAELVSVTLPDGSKWQLDGLFPLFAKNVEYLGEGGCDSPGNLLTTPITGYLTHPSGARGDFTLSPTRHGRTGVINECLTDIASQAQSTRYPKLFDTYALTKKVLSGPGITALEWNTGYPAAVSSWAPCNGCAATKTVEVTDPAGGQTRHTFGTLFRESEGQLQGTEIVDASGAVLRTTALRYREPVAPRGVSDQGRGDGLFSARVMKVDQRVIAQQGETFTWEALQFDPTYGEPTSVRRSSSHGFTRTDATVYHNNTSKWILGLVERVTETSTSGIEVQNAYNATTSNLESTRRFGRLEQSITYNTNGTVATRKDGLNQVTTFSNYKRGVPQTVLYHDGKSESAVVNDIGLISSTTNEAGFTTSYTYDAAGRLASINYPSSDTVTWNTTTVNTYQVAGTELGLPPGHWRQQVKTGQGYFVSYFDALWRPVYTEQWDQDDVAGTLRTLEYKYDFAGRTTFQSYPRRTFGQAVRGVFHTYDALGRQTSMAAKSEVGAPDGYAWTRTEY